MSANAQARQYFNPLPRKRENGGVTKTPPQQRDFNPLPRKRENCYHRKMGGSYWNFNPLPRKRENTNVRLWAELQTISIHSLVRGRTCCLLTPSMSNMISIHSLVRGRTSRRNQNLQLHYHFNPLPRKRENICAFRCFVHSRIFQSTPS